VDASGFFEQQLNGGTYLTFDQNISGQSIRFICTNFNGHPDRGSYIRVNGVIVASDHTRSPDELDNSAVGGSASFSGTGQYLSTNNTRLNLTGDFTVEGWFYPTNVTGAHALWTFGQASAGRYTVQLSGTSVLSNLYGDGSTTYTSTVPINTWTHVAMVRSGTTVKIYINGTASATTDTQSGTIGNGGYLNIGADDSGHTVFAGKITSFRVTNTAVYASNFTSSPNPLLPVTGTRLLLTELTSGDLVADTGPTRLTITNNGTVTWDSATPFTPGNPTTQPAPQDPPNNNGLGFCMRRGHTIVALNSDGTVQSTNWYDTWNDGTLGTTIAALLRSLLPGTIVAIGSYDATGVNQDFRDALTLYFGDTDYTNTWGGTRISQLFLGKRANLTSLSFNGSTDYKEITGTTSDWALGTTWTIEWWSKATSPSTGGSAIYTVMSQYDNLGGIGIDIFYQNNKLVINNGTIVADEPTSGVWTHVALVNNAGTTKLYYNGTSVYTGGNWNLGLSTATLVLGKRGQIPYQYFPGKLTGIRITNTAVYTGSFNPYTVAFPPAKVTGTKLLLNPETFNPLDDLSDSNHGFGAGSVSNSTDYPVAPPTYTLATAGNVTSVNEGTALTFNVTTTNIANGTVLNWVTDRNPTDAGGYPIAANRFSPAEYGSVTINSNTGTFTVTVSADSFTAPLPQLYNIAVAGSNTLLITVNDTSQTPAPITHTALQSASNSGSNGVHLDTGTYDAWVSTVPVGATIVADGYGTSTVTSIYTPTSPGNNNNNWWFVVTPGTFNFPSGTQFTFTWTA
jgi:hypothetical protein